MNEHSTIWVSFELNVAYPSPSSTSLVTLLFTDISTYLILLYPEIIAVQLFLLIIVDHLKYS